MLTQKLPDSVAAAIIAENNRLRKASVEILLETLALQEKQAADTGRRPSAELGAVQTGGPGGRLSRQGHSRPPSSIRA